MTETLSARRTVAAIAAGSVLVGSGLAWAAEAKASPETDYLNGLTDIGAVIYDTNAALATGYMICEAFNVTTGDVVAESLYRNTTWTDIPDRAAAVAWVVTAGTYLCPWHHHPERSTDGMLV